MNGSDFLFVKLCKKRIFNEFVRCVHLLAPYFSAYCIINRKLHHWKLKVSRQNLGRPMKRIGRPLKRGTTRLSFSFKILEMKCIPNKGLQVEAWLFLREASPSKLKSTFPSVYFTKCVSQKAHVSFTFWHLAYWSQLGCNSQIHIHLGFCSK